MKPVLSVAQIQQCDKQTIEEYEIPGIILMENASRAVAAAAVELLEEDVEGSLVWVFCGRGNNGGDGFALARHLLNLGAEVETFLIGSRDDLQGDAAYNHDLLLRIGGRVAELGDVDEFDPEDDAPDLIVDALFGTGFTGSVKEPYRQFIALINASQTTVLAVDIPSGVDGERGTVDGEAVRADQTVTFGQLKGGLLLPPGRDYAGEVIVADIGIPRVVTDEVEVGVYLFEEADAHERLPRRSPTAHKGDAGHVFSLAGSPGLTGAAVLAAQGALRVGTGLVVTGAPRSQQPVIAGAFAEAMTLPLPETAEGFLDERAYDEILERLEWAHALIFGPGVGKDDRTGRLLAKVIAGARQPMVIDADGLNLLARQPKLFGQLKPTTILTPHPGEFARLTGIMIREVLGDRLNLVKRFAMEWGVTVVLKGSPTLIGAADGKVYVNSTGNSGMATGGSGDVLTGILAGLIAQRLQPLDAALLGVWLHGHAGDLAAEELGIHGMIAGDIVRHLPAAIKGLE